MNVGVLLILGGLVFSVNTTGYDQLTRRARFNWASQTVIGRQPVYQYLGHGENTIELEGRVFPGQHGSPLSLRIFEQAAGLGLPMPLFSGGGLSLGAWCVSDYRETGTFLLDNGNPRVITFTLSLVQYAGLADYLTEQAGNTLKSSADLVQDFIRFLP